MGLPLATSPVSGRPRRSPRAWTAATLLALGCCWATSTPEAAELNLFDWIGPAPIVVEGEVLRGGGRILELEVRSVVRGPVDPGQTLAVDLRPVRRNRNGSDDPLRLDPGESLLMLLEPAPRRRNHDGPRYHLVRGARGVREVPAEGAPALLSAVNTLATIQSHMDERVTWESMRRLLEDPNPILIATSLRHHLKFRRGSPELVASLRPLLDHPRNDLRELTARLVGEVAARHPAPAIPEVGLLHAELAARARRDGDRAVRVAATEALDRLDREGTEDLLDQIAREDPDQLVRYTAERLLYERRLESRRGPEETP